MKHVLGIVLLVALVAFWPVFAQEPPNGDSDPVVDEVALPAYDADDQLIVQQLVAISQLAQADCQELESMRLYASTVAAVTTRMEAKYPGFTFDQMTGGLRTR